MLSRFPMLGTGIRGLLVVGLLTALGCADRGRGADRTTGRTGAGELNNDESPSGTGPDSGTSASDDPLINVMGDGGAAYAAYQRYLTTQRDLIEPICSCFESLGATSAAECRSDAELGLEDPCVADVVRTHTENTEAFFDCREVASFGFADCLSSQTCYDEIDYSYCFDPYESEMIACNSLLNEAERSALTVCWPG